MKNTLERLKSPRVWAHGLLSAFIGGGASTFSADQGISLAQRFNVQGVESLTLTELGVVFLSSGFVSAMMYLKQSPLPPIS